MAKLIDLLPSDFHEDYREERARSDAALTVIRMRTPHGLRMVDSPYDPWGEAETVIGEAGPEDRVLVLGTGSGYIAEKLLQRGVAHALMVTAGRVPAERTVSRLNLAGGENAAVTVVAADSVHLVWEAFVRPFLSETPEAKIIVHQREAEAYSAFLESLWLRCEQVRKPQGYTPKRPIRRVMIAGSGGILEPETAIEVASRGVKVAQVKAFAGRRMTPEQVLSILNRHAPDCVLSINHQGSDAKGLVPQACDLMGVPWGTWFLDDPRFIVSPEDEVRSGGRIGFFWDVSGAEAWREMGFQRAELLPLATDPRVFGPGDGDPTLKGRIVYVGSPHFERAEGFFAALSKDPDAKAVAEAFEGSVRKSRSAPTDEELGDALQSMGLEGRYGGEARRRLAAFVVQQANRNYRVEAIRRLADLNPVVYGRGWDGLLPDTVELRPPVDYYRGLPRVYRSDAVHLSLTHLQMRAYPNQRIFDAGICGGAVLNDRVERWSELFGDGLDGLVFDDFDRMHDMAGELMNDAGKRRRLGEATRTIVLEKHTIGRRVDRMLSVLNRDRKSGDDLPL